MAEANKPVPPPKRPVVAFGTLKGEAIPDEKPAPPPKPAKKPMGGVALPFAGGIPLQNVLKKAPASSTAATTQHTNPPGNGHVVIPNTFVPPPLPPAPKPAPEFFEAPPMPPQAPVDDDEPPPLPSHLPPDFDLMEESDDGEYVSDSDHGDKSDDDKDGHGNGNGDGSGHGGKHGHKPRPESNADLAEKSQVSQHDSQSKADLARDSTYSRIGGTEVSHHSGISQDIPHEGESKWVRFTSKDGDELIYNPYSHVVRLPKDPVEDDGRSNRAEFSQMRRNSAILGEAWEANRKTMAPVTEMSLEACGDSLAKMIKQAERILNTDGLSPEAAEELKAVLARMKAVHGVVQDNKIGNDDRTDVDAVLDIRHLPWDFKNETVDWYRAASTKKNLYPESEGLIPFEDWHFPQYYSDFPIPSECKQVNCVIRLPIPVDNVNNPWKGSFKINEPIAKCISQVFHKVKGRGFGHESEYVLKATGLNEFLRPAKTLGSYAYVRRCLRDREDVRLTLVKKPKPTEVEDGDKNMEGYKKKIKEDVVKDVKLDDHFANFSITDLDWGEVQQIPMSELNIPFKYKLVGLDQLDPVSLPRLQDSEMKVVYLETFMFVGMEKISPVNTNAFPLTDTIRFLQPMMGENAKDPLISNLSRNARLGFILWGVDVEDNPVRLAWVVMQLIDHHDVLASGMVTLRMWAFPGKKKSKHKVREVDPDFIFRATNRENRSTNHTPLLHLEFDRFALPVVAPQIEQPHTPNVRVVGTEYSVKRLDKEQTKVLANIIKQDSLFVLEPSHRDLVWLMRHSLVSYPSMLPKFLQSVKWGNPHCRHEAYRLLPLWSPPTAMADALELLDARYADYKVRQYAVSCLARLEDEELQLYLLQLTQCLKFEPYHHSPLSRFLVRRAIQSPFLIGHHFFWHLKAELHNPEFAERFTLLLEEFMSNCGRYAGELRKQHNAVLKMQRVAGMIVRLKREEGYADDQAMKEYAKELAKLNRGFFEPMGKFQIPLDPRWEAKTLIIEKCRYMSSKMVPLWLVFKNADEDAPPLYLIFKSGDDLRQDILTLQMLRIMDKLWLADGLDMRLKPYKCIATGVNESGEGVGMIEVVLNSDTTSGIQLKYGGGAMGALKLDPIDQFLHAHNDSPKLYEAAVENFVASCAGYCVATYVLGIGDRHNGNIMVTKDGHLFHIDFGHFLGNFKKKFGINRERAAFVFTPEMAYVMGGRRYRKSPQFKDFLKYCSRGYAILRKNAAIMETLFILMVSAGMPELMVEKDVAYLQEKLQLDVSEKKADKILHLEIDKSLDSTYRRFDNMIHNFKHG